MPTATPPLPAGPAAVLRALQSPALPTALRCPAERIETVETHMSWVFLLEDQVLKLKKPVRHDFLDFSTLAAREACCRRELQLNARLAPGVYRGLLALQCEDGRYRLSPEATLTGRQHVVDWLVWMNRLPRPRMLEQAIAERSVQAADIDTLARTLAAFYRQAAHRAVTPADYVARFEREWTGARELLLRPGWHIDGGAETFSRLARALRDQQDALHERAAGSHIVDGHGDLRPEHVCLLQPPVVIDCIEFNAALRQVDPYDELVFLGMECEMAGAAWIGPRLVERCAAALGACPPPAVLQLYTAFRALLRARLSLAHLLDLHPRTPGRWLPQAQRYMARARRALDALERREAGLSAARPRGFP